MIEIIQGDVLFSGAKAVILAIDGAKRGLEDHIARAYAPRWPDAWREIHGAIDRDRPNG